jgi:CheY-like chemotaxis protein
VNSGTDTPREQGRKAADKARPIAVVDDNSDDQFFLTRELHFLFGERPVITFHNGAALLHYMQDHFDDSERPWLILLDLHMTVMDGLRTMEFIHRRNSLAGIPIVIVSGTRDGREISAAFRHGARGFLRKPVSRLEIMKLLNSGTIVMN